MNGRAKSTAALHLSIPLTHPQNVLKKRENLNMSDNAIDSICTTIVIVSVLAYWYFRDLNPWWMNGGDK